MRREEWERKSGTQVFYLCEDDEDGVDEFVVFGDVEDPNPKVETIVQMFCIWIAPEIIY